MVRVGHDRPNALYSLNAFLPKSPGQCGATDDFLQLFPPGAYTGGGDLQDCVPQWLKTASRRPDRSVWGPSPGWKDLDAARATSPQLRLRDFADDVRCVDSSGGHDSLAAGLSGFATLTDDMGARYHTEERRRWRPTRTTPWLGFVVGT